MHDQSIIGQVLGHYRVIAEIGRGGMGVVYRARDEFLHRDVALKVVGAAADEKSSAHRLLQEARASSGLSHPNICTLYEVGEFDHEFYIVMELVEGKPLTDLIGNEGLPVETAIRYGGQIASALAHAHSRNIVHRDLKSSNIVVTPEGLVKILDFGLARRIASEALAGATLTEASLEAAGSISGTLSYMAPEVLRGEMADHRTDIWAMGIVLYEAAAGRLPFRGRTSFEITSGILHETTPPLPSRIPPSFSALVQRSLAKEPSQRYQRASEVQAALEAIHAMSITGSAQTPDQTGPFTSVQRGTRHLNLKNGDVLLMVGTTKGAFLLRSNPGRSRWDVAGPYFHGQTIYAMAYDGRGGRRRLWASTHSYWGTYLRSSDDFGKVWTNPPEANLKFPAETGASLANIWQICLGRPEEPDVLYCGAEPASLFESRDAGETWSLVRGLWDHPHRPRWMPGNGGLTLHTVVLDPADANRMYIGISAGGVYRTTDGGANWKACNRGIRVVYAPEKYPEFGQCVHKFAMHPARPDRLFLQNHWGLYRSEDAAESWQDIANGVPSDFGFPVIVHPHNPDCVYILPCESDEFRCTPDGRLRVFRSRNAGGSWEPLSKGLPQKRAYETVLRDCLTADTLDPAGIYFGTRGGELYGSADEGKNWKAILQGLPPIVCVKCAVFGEPRAARKPRTQPAHRPARARKGPAAVSRPKRRRS